MNARTATLAGLLLAATADSAQTVRWETDFAKAQKIAKQKKRMLFVDFYADW